MADTVDIDAIGIGNAAVRSPTHSWRRAGAIVWLTGLSGAGKSTIARGTHDLLKARSIAAEVLDGDELRRHIGGDLGFTCADREENVRRIGYVANLLARHGIFAIVSAISPHRHVRDEVRAQASSPFLEVYVAAPLQECERRDPKGLYRRARAGGLSNVTGLDQAYEPPLAPEVTCPTHEESVQASVDRVMRALGPIIDEPTDS
jgi:adenylyl-sulfate kinase